MDTHRRGSIDSVEIDCALVTGNDEERPFSREQRRSLTRRPLCLSHRVFAAAERLSCPSVTLQCETRTRLDQLQTVSGRSSEEVTALYDRLAPIYDLIYGVTLDHGRRLAMARLAPHPGETILEIGVGTGLSAVKYPAGCRAIAIDVSGAMIDRARARLRRRRIAHVALCRMDAAQLAFPDGAFDAVYAPYVMNVVPDPVRVAREMVRVCRPSGRLVIVNRFGQNERSLLGGVMDRLAPRVGFTWRLDLATFLRESNLIARSIEPANVPRFTTVVVCGKRPFLEDDFA